MPQLLQLCLSSSRSRRHRNWQFGSARRKASIFPGNALSLPAVASCEGWGSGCWCRHPADTFGNLGETPRLPRETRAPHELFRSWHSARASRYAARFSCSTVCDHRNEVRWGSLRSLSQPHQGGWPRARVARQHANGACQTAEAAWQLANVAGWEPRVVGPPAEVERSIRRVACCSPENMWVMGRSGFAPDVLLLSGINPALPTHRESPRISNPILHE